MKTFKLLLASLLCLVLVACAKTTVEHYANEKPVLEPKAFFNGTLTAHGVVKNRSGDVIRTFNADIKAWWEGDVGYLDEVFVFNNGERQTRFWTLKPNGAQSFIATAGDVIGEGIAHYDGNAFNLTYDLEIDYNDGKLVIGVDDWMWLVSDRVIINHSTMYKFGVRVGSIQLTIIKQS